VSRRSGDSQVVKEDASLISGADSCQRKSGSAAAARREGEIGSNESISILYNASEV
jgi:hypothetical protein